MCVLCKDYILEKLTRRELISAGRELLNTATSRAEIEHTIARLQEIQAEIDAEESIYE